MPLYGVGEIQYGGHLVYKYSSSLLRSDSTETNNSLIYEPYNVQCFGSWNISGSGLENSLMSATTTINVDGNVSKSSLYPLIKNNFDYNWTSASYLDIARCYAYYISSINKTRVSSKCYSSRWNVSSLIGKKVYGCMFLIEWARRSEGAGTQNMTLLNQSSDARGSTYNWLSGTGYNSRTIILDYPTISNTTKYRVIFDEPMDITDNYLFLNVYISDHEPQDSITSTPQYTDLSNQSINSIPAVDGTGYTFTRGMYLLWLEDESSGGE